MIGWGSIAACRPSASIAPAPTTTGSAADPISSWTSAAEEAQLVIEKIQAAVAAYPYPRLVPDLARPNSNTFTAFVGREVPELRLKLPSTAIGKDYLAGGRPSGWLRAARGVQTLCSGAGLACSAAWEEGVEVNVLGLAFGLDEAAGAEAARDRADWVFAAGR